MAEIPSNTTVACSLTRQRILDKLHHLPPEAVEQLDDFAAFLVARAEGGFYSHSEPPPPANELADSEPFLKTIRLLSPKDAMLIDQYVLVRAGSSLKWSYDDSASVAIAMDLMARDPFVRREIDAMNREFACAEGDGLDPY